MLLNSKQGQLTAASGSCLISCHNSHIKQNPYSPFMDLTKHDPAALNGRLASSLISVFPLLLLQSGRVVSVSSPCVFLSSARLLSVSLSQRLPHTFPRWLALTLPCSLSLTFFPLCSSLQRGEKHSCQIQVGHHTVSHPRQLLSTRRFDANKFFSIVVCYSVAPKQSSVCLRQDGKCNSCSVSLSMQQSSFGASLVVFRPFSQKGELLEMAPGPQQW